MTARDWRGSPRLTGALLAPRALLVFAALTVTVTPNV